MKRNKVIERRIPEPDLKYGSLLVSKLANFVMLDGEREKAEKIIYASFDKLALEYGLINQEQVLELFRNVLDKIVCDYEIRKMKFGGASYQIPVLSLEHRKDNIAMRLLIKNARVLSRNSFTAGKKNRSGTHMFTALFKEIKNIKENIGASIKHKEQLLKTVEANRTFMNLFNRKKKKRIKFNE